MSEAKRTVAGTIRVEPARRDDVAEIHALVRGLADYERLGDAFKATEADIAEGLFGATPAAEVLIARLDANPQEAAGFALFFHTYSTFLGRRGVWLEDLFVRAECRGRGVGRALLRALAQRARYCGGRFEWAVLDWNQPSIGFYESLGATILPDWRIVRVTGNALARLAGEHGE
jgi:GNAT superfamily N-acetyltransferase